jgi:hypothetical protein
MLTTRPPKPLCVSVCLCVSVGGGGVGGVFGVGYCTGYQEGHSGNKGRGVE